MTEFQVTIFIIALVNTFLVGFCAVALGEAMVHRIPDTDERKKWVKMFGSAIYYGVWLSGILLGASFVLWGGALLLDLAGLLFSNL